MVHKGPPDRKGGGGGGGPKFDQNKQGSNIPMAAGRRHQHQQQQHQDDGYKAAAAAAMADMRQVLKKARSIKRISESLQAHLSHKQVEQLRTPSPKKKPKRRLSTGLMLTPAPAGAAGAGWSVPNYMKATTSSDARIGRQQQPQPQHQQQQVSKGKLLFATPANKRHSTATPKPASSSSKTPPPTSTPGGGGASTSTPRTPKTVLLARKPSLKLVIPSTASINKSLVVAPLFENISVSKATCSSTLKDSKFPTELELNPGGTQLDGTSILRVCPYTYCSLNGHHAPAVPLRCFLSAKRRMIKAQKGVKLRRLPSPRKRIVVTTAGAAEIERENGLENEVSPQSTVLDEGNDDYFLEIYVNSNEGAAGDDAAFDGGQPRDREGEDNNDDEGQGSEVKEPSTVCRHVVDLDMMIPGNDTSYAEMNLVDDIIDRLSEISISEMEVTARFGECLDHEETTPDADIFASSVKGCGKHKSDDVSAMFGLVEFLQQQQQQQPLQDQASLTPSEAVEVDCQEEMPEYAADGAADDDEHDQATDQAAPDASSRSMDEVYFSLVFSNSATACMEDPSETAEEKDEETNRECFHGNGDDAFITGFEAEDHDLTQATTQETQGIAEEKAMTAAVPQSDCSSVHDELAEQDEQASEKGSNDVDDGQVPVEVGIVNPVADVVVLETSLIFPAKEPVITSIAAESEHLLPEMDGESRTGFRVTRKGCEEDTDQLREFNPRGPNFLPLKPEPEAEKVDLRHHTLNERENAEDGGSEATMVSGDEHIDMDNELPSKYDTNPVAEDSILERSLSCPEGKPAIRRSAAKPEQPLPEMDSDSRIKLIISRRSHEEYVEELTEFNPRGPNFLPLEPDPEAEKVDLRHQMMDERKNAEEWMIDCALQRAVNKLAPARNKKVALLVEAFETVAPPPIYKANPIRRHSSLGFVHVRPMQACS